MANGLGFSIGPFIGGKLATLGYDMPFIFSGLLTLLCFFIFSWRFRETHPKEKDGWSTFVLRLRHLVKTINLRKFRIFFLAFFIFCFGWSFYWEFIPVTWIKFYGLNVSQIGNFYAYGSAIYVLSSGLLIRPIIKRFKPLPILLFSLAALALCLFPLPFGTSWLYWIFIPLQQFLIALIFPVSTTIVSNAVAESRQGETLGAFQSLQSFAFAVTPFLGGALLHFNYNITVLLGGASMVLTCLILLNYKKHSMTKGARL